MIKINVKEIVQNWKNSLKEEIKNKNLSLVIFQVGDNPASNSYIKGKLKDGEELGVNCKLIKFSEEQPEEEILEEIQKVNYIEKPTGCIVQLPIRNKSLQIKMLNCIPSTCDVDVLNKLCFGLEPCTPTGIIKLLNELNFQFEGKVVVIIGRSRLVGEPLCRILKEKNMTVINCNSYTPKDKLESLCRESDLIVSAAGVQNLVGENCINKDKCQIFIDVGINRNSEGKLCGDLDPKIYNIKSNSLYTSVPGGVGLLTRYALFENLSELSKLQEKFEIKENL